MAHKPRRDTLRIAEEAAEWLEALPEGGAQTCVEFAAWLSASPRHVEEFLIMRALDDDARHVDPQRLMDVDKLLTQANANVVSLQTAGQEPVPCQDKGNFLRTGPRFRSGRAKSATAGIAALAVILALVWWLTPLLSGTQTFVTAIGEQRAIELEDGSIVHLNARSRVAVRLTKQTRDVRLLEGEALFRVAHDTTRPFRVHADHTLIRAIGTQFNVYRRARDTTVSVIEGRIELSRELPRPAPNAPSSRELAAGEAAQITSAGQITRSHLDSAQVTAWRQRRLIFRDSTLADIAMEFNRYNRTPQITVEGDILRARRYGGTFDADDPESLVEFLQPDNAVQIDHVGDHLIIRSHP